MVLFVLGMHPHVSDLKELHYLTTAQIITTAVMLNVIFVQSLM